MSFPATSQPQPRKVVHLHLGGAPAAKTPWVIRRLLWLLPLAYIFRVMILMRQREGEAFASVDSLALLSMGLTCLAALVVICVPNLKALFRRTRGTSFRMLLGYYLLGIVSGLWSGLPEYSIYRAFEVIVQMTAIFVAMSFCRDFIHAEKVALRASLFVILISIIGQIKNVGAISWYYLHTNNYTSMGAMVCIYCFAELFGTKGERRRRLITYAICSFIAVVLGTSSTANVSLAVGLLSVAFINASRFRGPIFILMLMLLLGQITGSFDSLKAKAQTILFPGKSEAQVASLGGRRNLWTYYSAEVMERPILGHGFVVATRLNEDRRSSSAHNMYLQMLLDLGAVGFGIFLVTATRLGRELLRNLRRGFSGAKGCLCLFIVAGMLNMGTPFLAIVWYPPAFVFTAFLAFHLLFVGSRNNNIPRFFLRPVPNYAGPAGQDEELTPRPIPS